MADTLRVFRINVLTKKITRVEKDIHQNHMRERIREVILAHNAKLHDY
jgi:hypothetical protein